MTKHNKPAGGTVKNVNEIVAKSADPVHILTVSNVSWVCLNHDKLRLLQPTVMSLSVDLEASLTKWNTFLRYRYIRMSQPSQKGTIPSYQFVENTVFHMLVLQCAKANHKSNKYNTGDSNRLIDRTFDAQLLDSCTSGPSN